MEEGRSQHRKIPQGGTSLRWVYMQKLRSEWCANVEDVREGIKNGERQKQTRHTYLTVLTISSVPSQGKNEKSYQEQHEQIGIRIHSKSLAYRRDSCSNGSDLIPKQKEIRKVLVLNFIGYNSTVMVYILLILLFTSDKLNSFKDRTKKSAKLTLLTEFFWLAKERKIRTRNKGINKRNILSSLFFQCSFCFQLEMTSFTMMGKMFPSFS